MTAIEHKELKGITIKNIIVTIISTASIVVSVMTTYFNLKNDMNELRDRQETTDRVNEIRLKVLESQVSVLQQEVQEIKYKQLK
jgi:putative exporter of polyketide antibiotics